MVRESPKYRAVCQEVVQNRGQRELLARRTLKEAVKSTKNALHQIAGAYLDSRPPYAQWLEEIAEATASGDREVLRQTCLRLMRRHASTRERMESLSEFYAFTLADIQPLRSVLDLACGLHPLSIPWMPLAPDAEYCAVDIYEDMRDFLNGFFAHAGLRGRAEARDVTTFQTEQPVQLALLLKALPLLEQQEKTVGLRLLRSLPATHLLVSFPTRSLGGRSKGMAQHYEAHFREMIQEEPWSVRRFEFPRELCFRVTKTENAPKSPSGQEIAP
jgi:16S rRNA (guanine(1405)-N(7))-methyltransferase